MALTRRQRALVKLQAFKARKRIHSSQESMYTGEKSDDVSEVEVFDSKTTEVHGHPNGKVADNEPNSSSSCRLDDEEQTGGNLNHQPETGDDSPKVVGSRSDNRDDSSEISSTEQIVDLSAKSNSKLNGGDKPPIVITDDDNTGKASPQRRFDIVDDHEHVPSKESRRSGSLSYKKAQKMKSSRKPRRSRKVPMKDNTTEDDASTIDSQPEHYLTEAKTDGIASALDHVFHYFDDFRSIGDDSYSIRTERTEETGQIPPVRSERGFFKDVEEIFLERFSCATMSMPCHGLDVPAHSYFEDESTISGTKDRKEEMESTKRTAGPSSRHSSLDGDSRSALSSVLLEDDDTFTDTTTVKDELHLENDTGTSDQDTDVAKKKSFDTQDGVLCRNFCNIGSDCLHDSGRVADGCEADRQNKLQELVSGAKRHAAKLKCNFKSDSSFQSVQNSLGETAGIESTILTSSRDIPILTKEDITKNSIPGEHSVAVEGNIMAEFFSAVSMLSNTIEAAIVDAKPIPEEHAEDRKEKDILKDKADDNVDGDSQMKDVEDEKESKNLYTSGHSIKPSVSFFSVDTGASGKEMPTSGFQEALAKLRDMNTASVTDTFRELETSLKGINLTPTEHTWFVEKFTEVFPCSADVNQETPSEVGTNEGVQNKPAVVEKFQYACSCAKVEHEEFATARSQDNVDAEDLNPKPKDTYSEDLTTEIVGDFFESKGDAKHVQSIDSGASNIVWDQHDWKPFEDSDCSASAGNQSIDTKATSNSTEDEVEHRSAEKTIPLRKPDPPSSSSRTKLQMAGCTQTDEKPPPKWRRMRLVPNIVRPFFKNKKQPTPTHLPVDDKKVLNVSTKMSTNSLGKQMFPVENIPQDDFTIDPFQASKSCISERQVWRTGQGDDFVEIINANTQAHDWKYTFPEMVKCTSMDAQTKASF